jgi:hypothetical protein
MSLRRLKLSIHEVVTPRGGGGGGGGEEEEEEEVKVKLKQADMELKCPIIINNYKFITTTQVR